MLEKPYTVDKFALRLDLSSQTVRRYIHLGLLNATKIGRKWFIEHDELERVLREGLPLEAP